MGLRLGGCKSSEGTATLSAVRVCTISCTCVDCYYCYTSYVCTGKCRVQSTEQLHECEIMPFPLGTKSINRLLSCTRYCTRYKYVYTLIKCSDRSPSAHLEKHEKKTFADLSRHRGPSRPASSSGVAPASARAAGIADTLARRRTRSSKASTTEYTTRIRSVRAFLPSQQFDTTPRRRNYLRS